MLSMEWKYLVLVPVAVVLSACSNGSNEKDNSSPASVYSGVWANQESINSFRRTNGDMELFCRELQVHPNQHGLRSDFRGGEAVLDAISISGGGIVSRYVSNLRAYGDNPNYAQSLRLGSIAPNGDFLRGGQVGPQGYANGFNYGGADYGDPRLPVLEGTFVAEGNGRLALLNTRGRMYAKTYLRSNDSEMRKYELAVARCLGNVAPPPNEPMGPIRRDERFGEMPPMRPGPPPPPVIFDQGPPPPGRFGGMPRPLPLPQQEQFDQGPQGPPPPPAQQVIPPRQTQVERRQALPPTGNLSPRVLQAPGQGRPPEPQPLAPGDEGDDDQQAPPQQPQRRR